MWQQFGSITDPVAEMLLRSTEALEADKRVEDCRGTVFLRFIN